MGFDVTILNLALPRMAEESHAGNAQLPGFVTVYTLVLAAGMIPAGMVGGRFFVAIPAGRTAQGLMVAPT
ncbi:hypothetical protein ACWEPC_01025 [Nonomuraea sp. NPDC004297]